MDKCPMCKRVFYDKYPGSRLANRDLCYGTGEAWCLESQLAAERERVEELLAFARRIIDWEGSYDWRGDCILEARNDAKKTLAALYGEEKNDG